MNRKELSFGTLMWRSHCSLTVTVPRFCALLGCPIVINAPNALSWPFSLIILGVEGWT